jgi:3-dehydrotetronate 4-kinase
MADRFLIGCVADDLTGATDLGGLLAREGLRTVQLVGVPDRDTVLPADTDAVVVALKTRSTPVADAVRESLDALRWLRDAGCERYYFKYCSTFDSTPRGNIGPVADALLAALGERMTVVCPAFPENDRTVYWGHLFVGGVPLAESGMRHHPVTPMTDSDLSRLLRPQTDGAVGLVPYPVVRDGAGAIRAHLDALGEQGHRYAVTDALDHTHLGSLAAACLPDRLCTGGSALAGALAAQLRTAGRIPARAAVDPPPGGGFAAVLAGSCSVATRAQVDRMRAGRKSFPVLADEIAAGRDVVAAALGWARTRLAAGPVLIHSSTDEAGFARSREVLGPRADQIIEDTLAGIARGLVSDGVRRLVVAGGETSGAVTRALGVTVLRIGAEIEPGVPIVSTVEEEPLTLVLKSGNFGTPEFFDKALRATG